jgi:hypothetical protein
MLSCASRVVVYKRCLSIVTKQMLDHVRISKVKVAFYSQAFMSYLVKRASTQAIRGTLFVTLMICSWHSAANSCNSSILSNRSRCHAGTSTESPPALRCGQRSIETRPSVPVPHGQNRAPNNQSKLELFKLSLCLFHPAQNSFAAISFTRWMTKRYDERRMHKSDAATAVSNRVGPLASS